MAAPGHRLTVLIFIIIIGTRFVKGYCPDGPSSLFNGFCYHVTDPIIHGHGFPECAALGYMPVKILSSSENAFITSLLTNVSWIGIFQSLTNTYWMLGGFVSYQPLGSTVHANQDVCCYSMDNVTGVWSTQDNDDCSVLRPFVCEIAELPDPPPTTAGPPTTTTDPPTTTAEMPTTTTTTTMPTTTTTTAELSIYTTTTTAALSTTTTTTTMATTTLEQSPITTAALTTSPLTQDNGFGSCNDDKPPCVTAVKMDPELGFGEVLDEKVVRRLGECLELCYQAGCCSFYLHSGNMTCVTLSTDKPSLIFLFVDWAFYLLQ